MPAVHTHDHIAMVTGVALVPLSGAAWLAIGRTPTDAFINTSLFVGAHFVCSYWLSPDLDINSTVIRRWGIFSFFWTPYERAIPHRHWISHSGFSVLLRLLYLLIPLLIIGMGVALVLGYPMGTVMGEIIGLMRKHPEPVGMLLAGAIFSDVLHTVADYLSTSYKRGLIRQIRNPSQRARRAARRQSPVRIIAILLRPGLWLKFRRSRQRVQQPAASARNRPASSKKPSLPPPSFVDRHIHTIWFVIGMVVALLLFLILVVLQQQVHLG